jgi:hypothetical protein
MGETEASFEHAQGFEHGELSGNLELGRLLGYYEELFAEVIEDGIITTEERARLDRMADSLGLDRTRLRKLEQALQAAYEARHQVVIREQGRESEHPPASLAPLEPATDTRTLALQRRIVALEAHIQELERALEEARSHVSVEVDLSDIGAAGGKGAAEDDPNELARRVRHDPRDDVSLHALYAHYARAGEPDRQWCAAHALVYLKEAGEDEGAFYFAHRGGALISPKGSLARDAWTRLLLHPEQETLVGEIFATVAPAVLMGRLSALRRDKALPKLDPAKKQNPAESTIQAVRCFSWAAAILGMTSPALYADPEHDGVADMVPGIPPAARLGRGALSGRSSAELAFLAGRHLALHRAEHFVRLLVPSVRDLEDIFLAGLSIGNPGLPLSSQVKELVVPIAKAIEPILEPAAIDRLRGHFLRFVEEGGRTNLQRWAAAVDHTAARAGLLLSNDLRAAHTILEAEDKAHVNDRIDDLLVFTMSDRYAKLRKQIGIAVN